MFHLPSTFLCQCGRWRSHRKHSAMAGVGPDGPGPGCASFDMAPLRNTTILLTFCFMASERPERVGLVGTDGPAELAIETAIVPEDMDIEAVPIRSAERKFILPPAVAIHLLGDSAGHAIP